jgi:hypothetical protein
VELEERTHRVQVVLAQMARGVVAVAQRLLRPLPLARVARAVRELNIQ